MTDKRPNVNFIFLRINQLVIKACILCFGLCLHHGPLDVFCNRYLGTTWQLVPGKEHQYFVFTSDARLLNGEFYKHLQIARHNSHRKKLHSTCSTYFKNVRESFSDMIYLDGVTWWRTIYFNINSLYNFNLHMYLKKWK